MNTTHKETPANYQIKLHVNTTLTLTFNAATKERANQIERALKAASSIQIDLHAHHSEKTTAAANKS